MNIDETIWPVYRELVNRNEDPATPEAKRLHDAIAERYWYLAKKVVGKMKQSMPSHVEKDDLESMAAFGLLQAIKRYDHEIGVPFEAYVTQNMWSKVRDGIREADWAPRSLRKKQRDIANAEEMLKQELSRQPTTAEVAESLEIEANDVAATKYRADISTHAYIDVSTEAQHKPHTVDESEDELVDLLCKTVAQAYRDLPLRLAAVMALHYYEEKKLSAVAEDLKMSEPRVSALHREAVLLIWDRVAKVLQKENE